jgi:hypothetical protein
MKLGSIETEFSSLPLPSHHRGSRKPSGDKVVLVAGSTARLDVLLELGSVGESVTVSA